MLIFSNYHTVIQRFFGMIRAAGGCDEKPRVSTFLQLFRLLACYFETKSVLNGNVDDGNGSDAKVLADYATFVKERCKFNREQRTAETIYMKKAIDLRMIIAEDEEDLQRAKRRREQLDEDGEREVGNAINDNIVFHVCGSLTRRRRSGCAECYATMVSSKYASNDANAADPAVQKLTRTKDTGGLVYSSANMFALVSQVEQAFLLKAKEKEVTDSEAFEDVIHDLCLDPLPPVGCPEHTKSCMADIIFDYLVCRFESYGKMLHEQQVKQREERNKSSRKSAKVY